MDVDIMIDCLRCSSQSWILEEDNDNYSLFECGSCGISSKVGKEPDYEYHDCHLCQSTKWTIIDKQEDHVIFECDNCSTVAEFWLNAE